MPLLSIFSAPKPFTDPHVATIQRNAIQSWLHLGPEVAVLLVGEETGLAEVAARAEVPLLSQVRRNAAGTPLVSSIFDLARQASDSPFLAYVNADILLITDIVQATQRIPAILATQPGLGSASARPFLLIGQRWDLDVTQPLDFSTGWEQRLRDEIVARGKLHPPAGSDYFIFPRFIFTDMPDFAIGRAGWDNWMIYFACQQGWPVIDGTPSIKIVHQNHDYSHLPGGKPHYNLEESRQNMAMAGGLANMYMVLDANYQFANGRLRSPVWTPQRAVRTVERWLMPKDGQLRGARGALTRRFRRLRRKLY
jgi:hypothetical protein